MRNRNDDRTEMLGKKVNNWRIVAGLLLLVAVYGLVGRMDRDAQIEQRMAATKQSPAPAQRQATIGGMVCKGVL